jgi:hypothetical protein
MKNTKIKNRTMDRNADFINAFKDKPKNKTKFDVYSEYKLLESNLWDINIELSKITNSQKYKIKTIIPALNEVVKEKLGHLINKDKVFIPGILGELKHINISKASIEDLSVIYDILKIIFEVLYSIGSKDGFLNSLDFSDSKVYPIISNKIPSLLDYEYMIPASVPAEEKIKIIEERRQNPIKFYKEIVSKS